MQPELLLGEPRLGSAVSPGTPFAARVRCENVRPEPLPWPPGSDHQRRHGR